MKVKLKENVVLETRIHPKGLADLPEQVAQDLIRRKLAEEHKAEPAAPQGGPPKK